MLPVPDAPADSASARLAAWIEACLAQPGPSFWGEAAIEGAAQRLGFDHGEQKRLAPEGGLDLIAGWAEAAAKAAEAALAAPDVSALKIREKVRCGVLAWLRALDRPGVNEPGARRAAAKAAFAYLLARARPDRAAGLYWRAADAIWRGLGDQSFDINYYTKRATLSAVLAAVTPVWIASSEDEALAFLDRRIEGVMRFEKLKGRIRLGLALTPSPTAALARLRYGLFRERHAPSEPVEPL